MKKNAFFLLSIIISVSTFIISSCKSSQSSASKMLKFNLQKGRGYDYDMSWDYNQAIMGQSLVMNIGAGYSLVIVNDDSTVKTIDAEFRNIKMKMQMMGMEINIDTDKPLSNTDTTGELGQVTKNVSEKLNQVFSQIKGKNFSMKVNREGKVLEVTGFDQLFSSMIDSTSMDEEGKQKIMQSVKQQFNDNDIKDRFADVFYIFPQKEVRVGDTWEKDYEGAASKMPVKNHTVYKVKEIEGDMVTIATKTDISSSDEKIKVDGNQTGTLIVDSRSGLVVNAEFNQEMSFSVNGMSFTMNGKGKIKGTAR